MRYCGSQGYFFYSPMAYGGGSSALSSKSIILCAFCGIVIDGFMKNQKRCRTAKGSCRHAEILLQNRERKMHTMLDLRNMSDAEFSISVAPPAPQSVLQVTIHEDDHVQLNSKLASQFAKKPVQLRFNPDFTALQIALTEEPYTDHFTFPKSGHKTIRGIADYFRKAHIPLPVVFRGILLDGSAKWRGERQANPFGKQSTTSRSTRKK